MLDSDLQTLEDRQTSLNNQIMNIKREHWGAAADGGWAQS